MIGKRFQFQTIKFLRAHLTSYFREKLYFRHSFLQYDRNLLGYFQFSLVQDRVFRPALYNPRLLAVFCWYRTEIPQMVKPVAFVCRYSQELLLLVPAMVLLTTLIFAAVHGFSPRKSLQLERVV